MDSSPDMIYDLRVALGESQRTFGKRFGASGRAVGKWEAGENKPSVAKQLQMEQLHKKVCEVKKSQALAAVADRKDAPNKEPKVLLSTQETHATLEEFQQVQDRYTVANAVEFVAKKEGLSELELRRATSLLLYIVSDVNSKLTTEELARMLAGHK